MTGVLGIFGSRDDLLRALEQARGRGFDCVTAFAPTYDQQLVEALAPGKSPVRRFALLGGITGGVSGLALTIWTTGQWPLLITGGKPLLSIPPFLVITFEMTILLGAIASLTGFVLWSILSRAPRTAPYDPRFSAGHFGLCVECQPREVDKVIRLLKENGASECRTQ